jgi:hypothetical protein
LTLKSGFEIGNLNIFNYKIEKLYIKLNEKFDVSAKFIEIDTENSGDFDINLIKPKKIFEKISILNKHFEAIKVEKISINDHFEGSFFYDQNSSAILNLSSTNLSIEANLTFYNKQIKIDVDTFFQNSAKFKINSKALISEGNIDILTNINSSDINLDSDFIAIVDDKGVNFKLDFHKNLSNITSIVDIFKLDPEISVWIDKYATFKTLKIEKFSGYMSFLNPLELVNNLNVKAKADRLNYVFAEGFEPIKSAYTDLVFKDSMLYIKPDKSSTFYNQATQNSWLKIDFSQDNYFINIFLDTKATLNSDILDLLNYYEIILPFKQLDKSYTELKMQIDVNLHDLDVKAQGNFKILPSFIEFDSKKYFIDSGTVILDNKNIKVENIHLLDKKLYSIFVNGDADLENRSGEIRATMEYLNVDISEKNRVELLDANKTYMIKYTLGYDHDQLSFVPTTWKFKDKNISVDGFDTNIKYKSDIVDNSYDFTFENVTIPKVKIYMPNKLNAYASGDIDIDKKSFIIDILVDKMELEELKLLDSDLQIVIENSDYTTVSLKNESNWHINDNKLNLSAIDINFTDSKIDFSNSYIRVEDQFQSDFNATIDTNNSTATIQIEKFDFHDKYLSIDEPFEIKLKDKNDYIDSNIDILSMNSQIYNDKIYVKLNSIDKITKYTTFFKDYNITEANATFMAAKGVDFYTLQADVKSSYKVLLNSQSEPTDIYKISTLFDSKNIDIKINNKLKIKKRESRIDISSDALSYNLSDILTFSSDHNLSKSSEKNRFHINFEATNGKLLLSKDRDILFDELTFEIIIDSVALEAQELKMQGKGTLDYKEDKIDALLDLQTDIGSSANKIPIVGYLLLGDENSTISTELKVDGNLSDPQFNTNITESIMS